MTECTQKITDEMTKTPVTKDTICKTYQDVYACYPSCICNDATYKDMIEESLKAMDDAVKAMDGGDCTLKCGSGSGSGSGVRRKFYYFLFFIFFLRSSRKCFSSFFFLLFFSHELSLAAALVVGLAAGPAAGPVVSPAVHPAVAAVGPAAASPAAPPTR